jgi:tellurium resistance protein TerZ
MAISLQKGQKISLDKESGQALNKIVMGLGWDMVKKAGGGGLLGGLFGGGGSDSGSIDLDASCVLFGENNVVLDTIWFAKLKSNDGSIVHTGDNRTGAGEGDDEQIVVELSKVPANATAMVFTVNSFSGQTFDKVSNAYCRIVNASNNQEVARYELGAQGSHTAQIMAKLYRHNGEWKMHAIGEVSSGRTIEQLIPSIIPFL